LRRDTDLEATLVAKYAALSLLLNERARRLWAAAESVAVGYGGDAVVSSATGLSRNTIRGRRELAEGRAAALTAEGWRVSATTVGHLVVCENPAESGSAENSQSAPISYPVEPRRAVRPDFQHFSERVGVTVACTRPPSSATS
jgi:hypothetical protein